MTDQLPEEHPVQHDRKIVAASTKITLRAYEVYRHVHGEQQALITGDCRGGFDSVELIAFLYARSFPRGEWRERSDEAFAGLKTKY